MLLLLLSLACVPLLALEPLRWHERHDNQRILRKAFWLMFSASVFWSLLADYVSTVYPGWGWFFYVVLAVGTALMSLCAWHHYGHFRSQRRTLYAVLAFVTVFSLTAWLVPDNVWFALRESIAPMGSLSHFRGPLH